MHENFQYLGHPPCRHRRHSGNQGRHDYLPFGEEILAGTGGRTPQNNYTADNLRQKFTQKERDVETGLDYFDARYYSNTQGRFTSSDPLLSSANVSAPQTWNRYSYAVNQPLKYTDPFGMYVCTGLKDQCKKVEKGLENLEKARDHFQNGSAEYNRLDRARQAYGRDGVDNGVTVKFGSSKGPAHTTIGIKTDPKDPGKKLVTADNPTGQDIVVTIDPTQSTTENDYVLNLTHEGSHVADGSDLVAALPMDLTSPTTANVLLGALNLTKYVTETRAYEAESYMAQGRGAPSLRAGPKGGFQYEIWNSGWKQADRALNRSAGIDSVLAEPKKNLGLYEVNAKQQGDKLMP